LLENLQNHGFDYGCGDNCSASPPTIRRWAQEPLKMRRMPLALHALGTLELVVDGRRVRLGGPKQRAILSLLAVEAGRTVPADRLIDEVWADAPGGSVRSLQVYVSELRRLLGDPARISADAGGYRLSLSPGESDAARFEVLAGEGARRLEADDPAAARLLGDALDLWRGDPYPGVVAPSVEAEARRLFELRLATRERWIDARLALGEHDALLPEIRAVVDDEPLREPARRQLMLALYRSGRQADALAAYQDGRRVLVDELGIEPGPELQSLELAILRQDPTLVVEPPEVRARRRLPAPLTGLIGREREVADLTALLEGPLRLVTLTGPGGTGKTRTALAAAHGLARHFPGGVVFVDLAPLRDPAHVGPQIAAALGRTDDRDPITSIVEHVGARGTLLLLDNFEHVDEAAPVVSELLRGAPGLKALVTSRHRMRLYGEHEYPIDPLDLDDEAMPLFAARAAASGRRLAPDPEMREVVARLDGLPLAIELAAARTAELTLGQMLGSLPRLSLAAGGPRDVPERQQTMERAIAWSHALLDERQRSAFAAMSVFAGGCAHDAATAVTGASEEQIEQLAVRSLLRSGAGRYEMLETLREFAAARLAESAVAVDTYQRHADWFLALAERADTILRAGRDQREWLDRVEVEHDNMRAALAWLLVSDGVRALRLGIALGYFWEWRGHSREGLRQLEAALAAAPAAPADLRTGGLLRAGIFELMQGDLDGARAALEEALTLARSAADAAMVARVLRSLATVARDHGQYDRALAMHEEALAISTESGDRYAVSSSLVNLSDVSLAIGDNAAARSYATQSALVDRAPGHELHLITSLLNLGLADLRLGLASEAADAYVEALELCERNQYAEGAAYGLLGVCGLLAERRAWDDAARMLGAADARIAEAGAVLEATERPMRSELEHRLESAIGRPNLERLMHEGVSWDLPTAIATGRRLASTAGAPDGQTNGPTG
jgi:predicted ATPase/DNA-binding SARP family transcriptional activator